MVIETKFRILGVCTLSAIFRVSGMSITLAGQATTAAIRGRVTDSSGAAVPGAGVVGTSMERHQAREDVLLRQLRGIEAEAWADPN
jgi:hypothetical protein